MAPQLAAISLHARPAGLLPAAVRPRHKCSTAAAMSRLVPLQPAAWTRLQPITQRRPVRLPVSRAGPRVKVTAATGNSGNRAAAEEPLTITAVRRMTKASRAKMKAAVIVCSTSTLHVARAKHEPMPIDRLLNLLCAGLQPQVQEALKMRGLDTSGTKPVLVDRLWAALSADAEVRPLQLRICCDCRHKLHLPNACMQACFLVDLQHIVCIQEAETSRADADGMPEEDSNETNTDADAAAEDEQEQDPEEAEQSITSLTQLKQMKKVPTR